MVGVGGSGAVPAEQDGPVTNNVIDDDIAKIDPEWDRKVYCGQASANGNSSWYASGNRLFFRTSGHLWCIGDSSQPYNWNPASRPADVTAQLQKAK